MQNLQVQQLQAENAYLRSQVKFWRNAQIITSLSIIIFAWVFLGDHCVSATKNRGLSLITPS